MPPTTDRSGVACCGNCGSQLEVRCTGGCAEPDVVFAESFIGTMRKPPGPRHCAPTRKPRAEFCNIAGCNLPVVPYSGKGQPPRKCALHLTKNLVRATR